MENNFVVEVDMDKWTPEQRQEHYLTVCASAGLDPSLGLLKYRHMDDGSGMGTKHLVLYATKDATNAIRDLKGIDITGLTDKVVNGAFVVTASAKDKKGRTDHAMGAASLEGKRGKALENAFALAQTRATRRVTLQMSGLPLIDESEVTNDGTTPIANADSPLDQIGQPAEVNSGAGTDITAPAGLTLKAPAAPQTATTSAPAANTEERLPNPAAGLKLATTNMPGPNASTRGNTAFPPLVPTPAEAPIVSKQTQSEESAPKKERRKRRTKAEMAGSTNGTIAPEILKAADELTHNLVESTKPLYAAAQAETPSEQAQAELEPLPAAKPEPVKVTISTELPTKEQMAVYVERLTKYRSEILPAGGMIPSHGMGVNKKLRAFIAVANSNQEDLMKLTVTQWEATFTYMDSVVAAQGAKELVKIIEVNIGASDEPKS